MRASLAAALLVAGFTGVALAVAGLAASQAGPSGAAGVSAQPKAPRDAPPRVLLVTWDTTRADRIGCYGWKRARTPGFDALAASGVLYERAWAPVPVTLPSHTTLLTGVLPSAHGVRDNVIFEVAPEAKLLSEAFRDAGWRTAACVGSFILDRKYGLDQGFDLYDDPDPSGEGLGWTVIERPAPAVAERALAFLDTVASQESFFLWVHFYDPHAPHEVAPSWKQPGEDDYDAEIALCDQELRRILERIRARGLDAGLITVVTSDHGESHGEHGEVTHGSFLYEATMRVPLVVAPPPPGVAPGTRVLEPVSTADVAATILERAGFERAQLPDARSPPLPAGDPAGAAAAAPSESERAIYLETFTPFHLHRWHPLRAVVWQGFKLIEAPRPELYELATDAREERNLHAERPDLARRLAARLAALAAEHPPLGWQLESEVTAEDEAKARQLGYGAAATGGDPTDPTLPDPKDRIGDLVLFDEISALLFEANDALGLGQGLRTGRRPEIPPERRRRGEALLAQARAKLETIRAAHPRDPYLDQIDSTIELNLGNYAAAIVPLERAVLATPRSMPLHYNLAVAYVNAGKKEWGLREMEKAVFVEPRSLAAHRWLVQFAVYQRDWAAAAYWADELAKCPGQSPGDLERGVKDRQRIVQELAKIGGEPRPPRPVTEEELAPEGVRAAPPQDLTPAEGPVREPDDQERK